MAKVKGVMLKFDVPNCDNSIIPSNCKINIPAKVPIEMDFNHCNPPIGFATVTQSGDALIFEGDICSPYNDIIPLVLSEGVGGSGGYYNNLKIDDNGIITEMDLKSVSFVMYPVNPDYTFEIVEESPATYEKLNVGDTFKLFEKGDERVFRKEKEGAIQIRDSSGNRCEKLGHMIYLYIGCAVYKEGENEQSR